MSDFQYPSGVAVSLKIEEETAMVFYKWAQRTFHMWYPIYVPPPLLMHTSVLVTGKPVRGFQPLGTISVEAKVLSIEAVKTRDNNRALVAKLDCEWINQRHEEVLGLCEVRAKKRAFEPHLTIAYNWCHGGWKAGKKTMPDLTAVRFVAEICEQFDPKWVKQIDSLPP